jgi:hypothetical protein
MAEPDRTSSHWVPAACTLPTVAQPFRLAEFDQLFGAAVRSVDRTGPARLRLELVPDAEVAARAADLLVRESACCSFFSFTLRMAGGRLLLDVEVPGEQVQVLDALAARAAPGGDRG